MDPINILVAINLFVSMSANMAGAKKGMKSNLSNVVTKPKTYLQKAPLNVSAVIFLILLLAVFNIGTFGDEIKSEFMVWRIIGAVVFVIFSWVQVIVYKSLGEYYSADMLIFKGHNLKTDGYFGLIRHPQYVSQLLSDIGAGIALMSFVALPAIILLELPLFILRAKFEDDMLNKHFKESHSEYKKKSGFVIPFIG